MEASNNKNRLNNYRIVFLCLALIFIPFFINQNQCQASDFDTQVQEHFRNGRFEKALTLLQRKKVRGSWDHINRANLQLRLGKYPEARAHLRAALAKTPWDNQAWRMLELTEDKLNLRNESPPIPWFIFRGILGLILTGVFLVILLKKSPSRTFVLHRQSFIFALLLFLFVSGVAEYQTRSLKELGFVKQTNTVLRSGPAETYLKIKNLAQGEEVRLTKRSETLQMPSDSLSRSPASEIRWIQVRVGSLLGWIPESATYSPR